MATATIDKDLRIPVYSPICTFCKHLRLDAERTCAAFPQGIPIEIWVGEHDHRTAWPGDNGIRFVAVDTPGALSDDPSTGG